ncbi:MAG: hypothetical protein KDJ39_09455 [Gammaproteobacteria bacterium]|nr:hypothetical protein [Gammaproteobacteria bacterium]
MESGDLDALRDVLAAGYRDIHHPDRRAALPTLFTHRMRHRSVYLFTRIVEINTGPDGVQAHCVVYVAMTGVRVDNVEALLRLHADVYRYSLAWRSDGRWRVTEAHWERVDEPRRALIGD